MCIIRCCSYAAGIKLPKAPSEYSKIIVTFSQNGEILVVKNKSDLTLQSDSIKVQLTQQETALFNAPGVALMQVRTYKSVYDAPGSRMWAIQVYPTNNEVILS